MQNVNMRVSDEAKALIDEAARAVGKSRTEFILDCARAHAIDVLMDRRVFLLSEEQHAAFMAALDNAPPANAELRKLMRRKPLWER